MKIVVKGYRGPGDWDLETKAIFRNKERAAKYANDLVAEGYQFCSVIIDGKLYIAGDILGDKK